MARSSYCGRERLVEPRTVSRSLADTIALPLVFPGRDELAAPADRIRNPFFLQIHRADAVDASVGLRWRVAAAATLSVNVLVPVNRDALRADVIPTAALEYAF